MAVQNPFFGKRDSDNFSSRSPVTGLSTGTASTGNSLASSGLGSNAAHQSSSPAARGVQASVPDAEETGGSKLTVGPNIKLKGVEITDCDTLVVEGTVEATMNSRVIKIAENGAFHGTAEIDIAEIHGKFDGTLTVRQKLVIFGSGKVSGKIRYGKVVIEEGGELTGQIEAGTSHSSGASNSSSSSSAWSSKPASTPAAASSAEVVASSAAA